MTPAIRKLIVLAVVALILLLANASVIVDWLSATGILGWAVAIRREYLTGTAVTVILVLLVLVVRPGRGPKDRWRRILRCRVCHHLVLSGGSYCPLCGARRWAARTPRMRS